MQVCSLYHYQYREILLDVQNRHVFYNYIRLHSQHYARDGEICNKGCYRSEGCKIHWKASTRVPCKECGKLTFSVFRFKDYYQRKTLAKITQNVSESNTTAKENARSAHVNDE